MGCLTLEPQQSPTHAGWEAIRPPLQQVSLSLIQKLPDRGSRVVTCLLPLPFSLAPLPTLSQ